MSLNDLGRDVFPLGRIVDGNIQLLGTCFSIGESKYATAAHVVGLSDKNLHLVRLPASIASGYQDTTDDRVTSTPATIVAYDPIRDIAIVHGPVPWTFSLTPPIFRRPTPQVFFEEAVITWRTEIKCRHLDFPTLYTDGWC
ncbi:hypothetical protein QP185_18210 [Sphingomonas aerolata]|uniref:hypothetical protein n=1 Tax=Sphingomonas aerolata TaxID=185951 RepID=UPI002FE159E1